MTHRIRLMFASLVACTAHAQGNPAQIDWQQVGGLQVARTETSVGQFRRFATATATVTAAERSGGGSVFEAGWTQKPGWNWKTPFGGGRPAHDEEPAVHITYTEAAAFCRWAGGRLPTDVEWTTAAYVEHRPNPPSRFVRGRTYAYPLGDDPTGAQCLGDCGSEAQVRAIRHGAVLARGHGHARVDATRPGVNGLHDMGANVWEWVDDPASASPETPRGTRGGSWWYGAAQMRADHLQHKAPDTAVVYIGFRCVKDR